MFDSLGSEMGALKFFIAFAVVIGLIALTAWLVRRFGSSRLAGNTRGRQPRLAVIDAASVDGRRRLVLIRRDNVEHLLIIGGPTDVVVEQNIVRASARGEREAAPRGVAIDSSSPSLQPSPEPTPVSGRSYRNDDDNWNTPEPARDIAPVRETFREPPAAPARIRPDSLTGMAADLSAKLMAPEPVAPSFGRNTTPVETFGRPAPEPVRRDTDADNLAEMASRLEAALRRPQESHPPVTDPLAVAPVNPPRSRAAEPRLAEPRVAEPRIAEPRIPEPRIAEPRMPEARASEFRAPEPKAESMTSRAAPEAFAPPPPPAPAMADSKAGSNSIYESLEQEMASLLGRPANKQ